MHIINSEVLFVSLFSDAFVCTMNLEQTNSSGMEDLPERFYRKKLYIRVIHKNEQKRD